MRRATLIWMVGVLSLGSAISSLGAVYSGTYTFGTSNNDAPAPDSGVSFSSFSATTVSPGTLTVDAWDATTQRHSAANWGTVAGVNYISFVLSPQTGTSGYALSLLRFDVTTTHMTANSGTWQISGGITPLSGTFANLADGTVSGITIQPATPLIFDSALTIKFSGLGRNGGNDAHMAFDNVFIEGTSPVPEPVNVALGIFASVFAIAGLARTERVRRLLRRA